MVQMMKKSLNRVFRKANEQGCQLQESKFVYKKKNYNCLLIDFELVTLQILKFTDLQGVFLSLKQKSKIWNRNFFELIGANRFLEAHRCTTLLNKA